jgi:hypothetical protein
MKILNECKKKIPVVNPLLSKGQELIVDTAKVFHIPTCLKMFVLKTTFEVENCWDFSPELAV